MNDALEMYEGVLINIRQYQSAVFDIQDFNFYINQAVQKLLRSELDQFEMTQKVTDKVAALIKTVPGPLNPTDSTDVRIMSLPPDYRHVVSALVRLRYKTPTASFPAAATRSDYTKRLTGDSQAAIFDNYYLKPLVSDSSLRLYHRVIGGNLSLIIDTPAEPQSVVVIENVLLEYISEAPKIEIDTVTEAITTDTVFPSQFNQEIVNECAKMFLESNESPRLPTYDAANK